MLNTRKPALAAILVVAAIGGSAAILAQGRGGGRAGWVTITEGEECPPGTTEARHLQCAPPASPAPSILDYRPRTTVVADAHPVPKAKFPVVDVHTHGTSAYVNNPERLKEMDALNLYRNALRVEPGLPPAPCPLLRQNV